VSAREAAAHLGIGLRTLRRRIADGTYTAYRVGPRLIKLDLAEIDRELPTLPTARRST
jgi:excisionase family DNA binding protein